MSKCNLYHLYNGIEYYYSSDNWMKSTDLFESVPKPKLEIELQASITNNFLKMHEKSIQVRDGLNVFDESINGFIFFAQNKFIEVLDDCIVGIFDDSTERYAKLSVTLLNFIEDSSEYNLNDEYTYYKYRFDKLKVDNLIDTYMEMLPNKYNRLVWRELIIYSALYKSSGCTQHWEVNQIITNDQMWKEFKEIRSINNHGDNKIVKGIKPVYFKTVCAMLKITADSGSPLIDFKSY